MSRISKFFLPCTRGIYNTLLKFTINVFNLISSLILSPSHEHDPKPPKPGSPETEHPVPAFGWAARDTSGVLSPFMFSRRATRERDVQFKVLYCGICHSDLHQVKNEFGIAIYPIVPGHEIVGVVTEVGSRVEKVKVGDKVGVGCMVGSCRKCDQCADHLENYCPKAIFTYSSVDTDGTVTYGGYSNIMVADEHFIVRWPEALPLDRGAPLLCAGTTTYSALRYYGLDRPGLHVGVVGLGGLGHVAVKFAKAFGARVTAITTSPAKGADAVRTMGADDFILSGGEAAAAAAAGTMDGIIDTVPAAHEVGPLLGMLKVGGRLVVVGLPEKPLEVAAFAVVAGRKAVSGSMIGGMRETQEMIEFAAEHNIVPDVEMVSIDYVNKAMERLGKGDVKYRFVIDVGKTLKAD
ncbi:Probable cinnamyl alcohol dehydrogenase 6 [Striga hermonthica]|uniref:Probable cinnamyl alcohol dehydrogenase 6 n=1 Tax=Striga hermonthica TaxID=68872 RepID=A0A9N7NN79_STRHE|nr:Probable cinnamyl alcohol dehydrogenase 6 [Striga hermonthica]